jgi:putative flippase GtrA
VSAPPLCRRRTTGADVAETSTPAVEQRTTGVRGVPTRAVERLRRDDGLAQFGRFVLVGGISSLLYAAVFVCCRALGDQAANVIGSVLSSMLANELHRRLTFHAGDRVRWFTAQWEAGGIALIGILATALALGWLDDDTDVDGTVTRLLLVGLVTGAIGLGRFVALRWLFVPRARRSA